MLKPSAAPCVNHVLDRVGELLGVPANERWPRPQPSLASSWRTVRFSPCARFGDQRRAALEALDLVLLGHLGQRRVEFGSVRSTSKYLEIW